MKAHTLGIFILLALAFGAFADPPTPFWGGNPDWTIRLRVYSKNSTGEPYNMTASYYYNWNVKGERYDYDENQSAQMCRASGFTNWDKVKCNVIYSSDGWSYVHFPNAPYCCKCTNSFGGVRYDWLQADSKYIGREDYNGTTADHWLKYGNPDLGPLPNNYWATVGDQKPVRFMENSTSVFKEVIFDLSTYKTNTASASYFLPPDNCQTLCGGLCEKLRGETNNLQTE